MAFAADTALGGFLGSLGLARYVPLFDADELDMETVRLLQLHDYEQMGVPRGPRLKIVAALRALEGGSSVAGTEPYTAPVGVGVGVGVGGSAPASPLAAHIHPLYDGIVASSRQHSPEAGAAAAAATTFAQSAAAQLMQAVAQQQALPSPRLPSPSRELYAAAAASAPRSAASSSGSLLQTGAPAANRDVSRVLLLSPQSAATMSFGASSLREDTDKALSPVEREAKDFLDEMDGLLAEARERLSKRANSSRQQPTPSAGNMSASSRIVPDASTAAGGAAAQRSAEWSTNASTGRGRADVTSGSPASQHPAASRVAPSPARSTLPGIFSTTLTSSDEEEDDENGGVDQHEHEHEHERETIGGKAVGTTVAAGDATSSDEDEPKEATPAAPDTAEAVAELPRPTAGAAVGATAVSDASQFLTDAAESVRAEVATLAALRNAEELLGAIFDRFPIDFRPFSRLMWVCMLCSRSRRAAERAHNLRGGPPGGFGVLRCEGDYVLKTMEFTPEIMDLMLKNDEIMIDFVLKMMDFILNSDEL